MCKRILPLLVAALLTLTIVAGAAETRVARANITLTFQGSSAVCVASVQDEGKQVKATLELWCGTTMVGCWDASGTSLVEFDETATVTRGKTYRLTLVGTSNGKAFTPVNISKTCP